MLEDKERQDAINRSREAKERNRKAIAALHSLEDSKVVKEDIPQATLSIPPFTPTAVVEYAIIRDLGHSVDILYIMKSPVEFIPEILTFNLFSTKLANVSKLEMIEGFILSHANDRINHMKERASESIKEMYTSGNSSVREVTESFNKMYSINIVRLVRGNLTMVNKKATEKPFDRELEVQIDGEKLFLRESTYLYIMSKTEEDLKNGHEFNARPPIGINTPSISLDGLSTTHDTYSDEWNNSYRRCYITRKNQIKLLNPAHSM